MAKWWLCGKMTDEPEYNYPAFRDWATKLRAEGYEIINPATLVGPTTARTHAECMRICAPFLFHSETVGALVIPDPDPHAWTRSRGASWEADTILLLGKQLLAADTKRPLMERYVHMGAVFTPTERIEGLAGRMSETEMLSGYRVIEGDMPAGVELEPCEASQQRRAG